MLGLPHEPVSSEVLNTLKTVEVALRRTMEQTVTVIETHTDDAELRQIWQHGVGRQCTFEYLKDK